MNQSDYVWRVVGSISDSTLYNALTYISDTVKEVLDGSDSTKIILNLGTREVSALQDRGWIEVFSEEEYHNELNNALKSLDCLRKKDTSGYNGRELIFHDVKCRRASKRVDRLRFYFPVIEPEIGQNSKEFEYVIGLTEFGIENIKEYASRTKCFKRPTNINGFPLNDKQLYDLLNGIGEGKLLVIAQGAADGLYDLLNALGKGDLAVTEPGVAKRLYSLGYIRATERISAEERDERLNAVKSHHLIDVSDQIAIGVGLQQKKNELELEGKELESIVRQNGDYITKFELTKTGEAERTRLKEKLSK